jgi:hypothetical protein
MALPDDVSAQLEQARGAAYERNTWALVDLLGSKEPAVSDYASEALLRNDNLLGRLVILAHETLPWSRIRDEQGRETTPSHDQVAAWITALKCEKGILMANLGPAFRGAGTRVYADWLWRAWLCGTFYPECLPSLIPETCQWDPDSPPDWEWTREWTTTTRGAARGPVRFFQEELLGRAPIWRSMDDVLADPRLLDPPRLSNVFVTCAPSRPTSTSTTRAVRPVTDLGAVAAAGLWAGIPPAEGVVPDQRCLELWAITGGFRR